MANTLPPGPIKVRVHTAWSLVDSFIYGGGFLFALFVAAWAIVAMRRSGVGVVESYAAFSLPVAWAGISLRRLYTRQAFIDSIAWVTVDGLSVIPGDARDWLGQRRTEFDHKVDDVIVWWADWFATHKNDINGDHKIADFMNGMCVIVHVQDKPIIDYRHGVSARGLFYPWEIHVQVTRGDLNAGGAVFWALIGHELTHAALTAMGVEPSTPAQHAVMADAGWSDL